MATAVKICGITRVEDALAAAHALVCRDQKSRFAVLDASDSLLWLTFAYGYLRDTGCNRQNR
jgi:hypothetical protein